MVLEVAVLNVRLGQEAAFEQAIARAKSLIAASPGFGNMEVRRCVEAANRYLLLVTWDKLEDHTEGFRKSNRYQEWRTLLHHFYDPFPVVEHYEDPIKL